ncbi:Protein of unknown function [Bacillus mycoides]|nr:Protein of unknown function [Bacillus mycoides]
MAGIRNESGGDAYI